MSILIVGKSGSWECNGDRLKIWVDDFEKYGKMDEKDKKDYLNGLIYPHRFLELYEKWAYLNEAGQRVNFNCGYSDRLFPAMTTPKTIIPDPATVASLEGRLGRSLTLHEKEACEVECGDILIKIPRIEFPED